MILIISGVFLNIELKNYLDYLGLVDRVRVNQYHVERVDPVEVNLCM